MVKTRPRLLALLCAISIMLGVFASECAAEAAGQYHVLTADSRAYVPFRAIAEGLGFRVSWDERNRTAYASKGECTFSIHVPAGITSISFVEHPIHVPFRIVDNRIYVDPQIFSNYADCTVTIDGALARVEPQKPDPARSSLRSSRLIAKERYNYRYFEVMVPMDDGVRLRTIVYLPEGEGPWPVVLTRTPYGNVQGDTLVIGQEYAKRGMGFIQQYCRGKGGSEGVFTPNDDERADGIATLNWLANQPWCKSIGLRGLSYMGLCTWIVGDSLPDKVKAMHIQHYGVDRHLSLFKDGLFRHDVITGWTMQNCQINIPFTYENFIKSALYRPHIDVDREVWKSDLPFYRDWITHTDYSSDYWNKGVWGDLKRVVGKINVPVTIVAGLYDHHLEGTLAGFERLNPETRARSRLILGSWTHTFNPTPTHHNPRNISMDIEVDTFNFLYSICELGVQPKPEVRVYFVGSDRWVTLDEWPIKPDGEETLYFSSSARGDIVNARSLKTANDSVTETVRYTYDPENPVWTVAGETVLTSSHLRGSKLQPEPGYRSDVVTFISDALQHDMTIGGPVRVKLFVSTDVEDTCFAVTISEVLPDGRTYNMRNGITTLAYRNNSLGNRQAYTPNTIEEINITTLPLTWTVKAGNRIRVDITSSNFPEYSVHSNTAGIWAEQATTKIAHQSVYTGGEYPSSVTFPTIDISKR